MRNDNKGNVNTSINETSINETSINKTNTIKKFMFSTIANFAGISVVYPFDNIRIKQHNNIKINYKFSYLYNGYTSSLLKQTTYSVPNVFIYSQLLTNYKNTEKKEPSLLTKLAYGSFSGSIAGFLGTPSEVIMVRAISSPNKFPGIIPTIKNTYQTHGLKEFYHGYQPTIIRAFLFNGPKLAFYTECKNKLSNNYPELKGTIKLHAFSAFVSTTIGTIISNPFDVVKTRMQTPGKIQTSNTKKNEIYNTIKNIFQKEGFSAFYKGTIPSLIKNTPHAVISFVLLDQLSSYFIGKEAL